METSLTQITDYLLTQSWQIAILVVVIGAVNFTLRNKSAHSRYLLWLIVLAKCFVPPLLNIPLAILPSQERVEFAPASPPAYILPPQHEAVDVAKLEPSILRSSPSERPPLPKVQEGKPRFTIREWLAIGWIVGTSVFLAFNLLRALRANLWLWRRRKRLPAKLRSNIQRVFSPHHIKRFPEIWLVEGFNQPFIWGLWRGSVYLPVNFLNINRPEHQRSVLVHELSHVLRFDAAVNILQVIAQAIFWFHPLVWWANRKIRGEREKCCDEMAVARLNTSPRDYSTAILETLSAKHKQIRPVPSLAVASPVKNIEDRIKTMLKPGKKFYKRPNLIAATIVLLIALLTAPTDLVLTARASERQQGRVLAYDEFDGKLNLEWEILNPDTSHYSLSKNPDALTITTQDGTFCRGRTDYKNLFLIDCPTTPGENFQLTTCISSFKPVAAFNQAGLICWNDVDNSLKLDYEWCVDIPSSGIEAQRVFTAATESQKGGQEVLRVAWFPANQQLQRVWLRITKQGNRYTFDTSSDGKYFAPLGAPLRGTMDIFDSSVWWGDGTVKSVGLFANNGSRNGTPQIEASFEFFEVKALPVTKLELLRSMMGLSEAAAVGDAAQVKLCISKGADLNERSSTGNTALHYAAKNGCTEAVEVLIGSRADVNAKDKNGQTPLHVVAWEGHKQVGEVLLAGRADIMAKDRWGRTPLHQAASNNQKDVAEFLIAKGADVNVQSTSEWAPLHRAVGYGYKEMTRLLITKGADIHAKCQGVTPLDFAINRGHSDLLELLLTNGADVNAGLRTAARSGKNEMVELLLSKGANVNASDENGLTALAAAMMTGRDNRKATVDLLLSRGAQVYPLHWAAYLGDVERVMVLITGGTAIDAKWAYNRTALHAAALRGHRHVAELLIEKGANVNAEGYQGITPLHDAIRLGRKEIAQLLISKGADVNAKANDNKWTATPLHRAAWEERKEIAEMLIAAGALINAKEDNSFVTPLHSAVYVGDKDVTELLISKGSDTNAKDSDGSTPLHRASRRGPHTMYVEIAELLIARGTDINAKDNEGRTALSWAKERGFIQMTRLLRKHGAKE